MQVISNLPMARNLVAIFGKKKGTELYKMGLTVEEEEHRLEWWNGLINSIIHNDVSYMLKGIAYNHRPVGIRVFIENPFFMDKAGTVYPAVMSELEEINSGKYVETIYTGGIGCLPYDTEYLTPTGWVPISEYDGGAVGEYDSVSGVVSFKIPKSYIKLPSTDFWHFKTKVSGADMLLSDEHRVLWENRRTKKRYVSLAKDVASQHNKNSIGFEGYIPATFTRDDAVGLPLTDAQLRVLVAVIADGSFDSRNEYQPIGGLLCSVAIKKDRKKERLRGLLSNAGISWREHAISGRDGFLRITFTSPLRKKEFDTYFWAASNHQLHVITDEVFHWDGSVRDTERSPKNKRFFTTDKESVDFIQYALAACGVRSNFNVDTNCRSFSNSKPLYCLSTTTKPNFGIASTTKTQAEKINYGDGFKYCFETSTGFFIARNKSCIFATGNSGKTTAALYTICYQTYLLSCMRSPHRVFGLDESSEILMVFQSLTATLSKTLDYARFKSMVDGCRYFRDNFPYNKDIESRLDFPNRISIVPLSGKETAAIGQNILGGILDEVNYMNVIENSKKSLDGEVFDQAVALYNSIARRRKSRFASAGTLPGMLCLVSSKRYPGQFTDIKEQEAKTDKTIYIYDKRVWDIKPEGSFSGVMFQVFIGDEGRRPRILGDAEYVDPEDRHLVDDVPVEYKTDFERDITNSLREIAGKSTLATHPFIVDTNSITRCMSRPTTSSIFSAEYCDFVQYPLYLLPENFHKPQLQRAAHIDLGITGDSAGLAIMTVTGFEKMIRQDGTPGEVLPKYHVDGVLEVRPPKGGEILFWKIRSIIMKLRELGLNIQWVSLDSFQSRDTLQILRQQGFVTGLLSVDKTMLPYETLKTALYDSRVSMPFHVKLRKELASLENDTAKGKIDHPSLPGSSKDCLAGDTLIPMLDGTVAQISDLVGKDVWVYSSTSSGRVVPALARNIHAVGIRPVVRVTLDSGATFDCTDDHEIMLRDGSFVEAKNLHSGSSLMPLYDRLSVGNSRTSLNGYHQVWCNEQKSFVFTHQLVAAEVFGFKYGASKEGRKVIHHVDFNKLNNDPSNLVVMGWSEHRDYHNKVGTTNLKNQWLKPDFRAASSLASSKTGKRTGPINLTKYNKSPARIEKLRKDGLFVRNGKKTGEILKALWLDPVYAKKHAKVGNDNHNARKDITLPLIFSTAKTCATLKDVCFRLNCDVKVVHRLLKQDGKTTKDVMVLLDASAKKPLHNQRVDLTYAHICAEAKKHVTLHGLYSALGCTPSLIRNRYSKEQISEIKSFLLKTPRNTNVCDYHNHKVVSVEYLKEPCNVYDMTVDEHHNFAISSGVFVHNCADALAACSYVLASRRIVWATHGISVAEMPEQFRKLASGISQEEAPQKEETSTGGMYSADEMAAWGAAK